MLARLGADSDLLQLLLADLAGLVALLRIGEAHLAVVEDLADWRALVGGPLPPVHARPFRPFPSPRGRARTHPFSPAPRFAAPASAARPVWPFPRPARSARYRAVLRRARLGGPG